MLLGIAVAVYLPADLIFAAIDETRTWGDVSIDRLALGTAVFSFADVFAYAACVVALVDQRVGVGAAILRAVRRAPTLILLTLVMFTGVGLGLVALIVPGIVLLVWWWVAYQATVLEDLGWRPALGRSRELARSHFWLVLLIALGSCGGYVLVEYVLFLRLGNSFLPGFWSAWLMGGLTDVLTLPLGAAVTTALYLELTKALSTRR